MKTATRLISSAVLLTSAFFVSSALACNTTAWDGGVADATAGDPKADGIARVSGLCGMKVTAANGHVADNSPADETTFIGRFYLYPKNVAAGSQEIFVALSDQTDSGSDVFVISYNSGNITLDASAAGGNSVSVAADPTHWNLVEFAWTSGGTGELWVNADATSDPATDTFTPGTGSIDRVEMGGADGALFDDYESHRSLPVGLAGICDSDGNGSVNINDVLAVVDETFTFPSTLAAGSPDCDLNAAVNINDVLAIVDIIF